MLKSDSNRSKQKMVFVARKLHYHVAQHPHEVLNRHSKTYAKWNSYKYRNHFHYAAITISAVAIVSVLSITGLVHASGSTWTQTDWSGGVGSSTVNQYSSESNAVTTTANQVTQSLPPNLISNSGFESNLNSWQGGLSPSSIAGLESWYQATSISGVSNGGNVTSWADSSGNGHDLSQNTGANEPVYESSDIGGQPAVRFNGTSDYMAGTASGFTNAATVFTDQTVRSSVTGGTFEYGINSGVNTGISQLPWGGTMYSRSDGIGAGDITWAYTTPLTAIISQEFNGTTRVSQAWQDSVSKGTSSTGSTYAAGINTVTVGALTPSNYFEPTDLGELIAYDTALTTTQRQGIEAYLANKYDDTTANYVTATQDNSVEHSGSASAKLVSGTNGGDYVQYVNVGTTSSYNLSAYVYDGGSAVTSSVAQLYYNGNAITTTYTNTGGGWYKLSASVTGINASTPYGIYVSPSQTIHLDDVYLQLPVSNGTLTSSILNTGVEENWGNLSYSATVPTNTTVSVLVRAGNQANLSDAPAFTACSPIASGSAITSTCAPTKSQYVQYQLQFTSDGSATPTFTSISIPYTASDIIPPPTNASNILAYSSHGGSSVASNGWVNSSPYFSWTAGADNVGGSGLAGYCLYVGTSSSGNPITSEGDLGTSPLNTNGVCPFAVSSNSVDLSTAGYLGTALSSSTSPYYINIVAIDNAGNVYAGSPASFQFRFDNTPPANPSFINAPSNFTADPIVDLTWPTTGSFAASDADSGVLGLQYKIGSSGTWYGAGHSGTQDCTDTLPIADGSYTTVDPIDTDNLVQGDNIVYFRTWDTACNVSSTDVTTVIKLNSTSPSTPQDLTATPTTNTTNAFAFAWAAPASFSGNAANITYCYTINSLPTVSNCTYTSAGTTSLASGAYATQPGDNTFYVVARDEAGNINYATAASTTFTANTAAPGVPLNMDIADISTKATQSWKLALSWNTPSTVGAGIASYKIYRSTDGSNYSQIASTAGTSYVDSSLNQQVYYYEVQACDSADNCGGLSSSVSLLPTGKFTSPASLISGPNTTETTRTATISFTTDRDSNSSVEYGLSSNHYFPNSVSNDAQVTSHDVTLSNLEAGTTYYYRALWADVDGNTGTSAEGIFTTLPAPTVSDVNVSGINLSTATIQFTTSNATQVQLIYGPNGSTSNTQNLNTSTSTSTYTIQLTGLAAGTTYTYKLNPTDVAGNLYQSIAFYSFTTPPAPAISNIQFSPVPGALTGTETVAWTTNVAASSDITYSQSGKGNNELINSALTTTHTMTIANLNYNTLYNLVAKSTDNLGNTATSDQQIFHTGLDTRPPRVSNVVLQPSIIGTGADAAGQIVVSWKTDKPGGSQVEYGQGSGGNDYTSKTAEDTNLVLNHVVVISGLPPAHVYHLKVLSTDSAGNTGVSGDQTTIVGQATDSVLTIILGALQAIYSGL